MSKTLDQIYMINPITTNASTDLMYFSQTPYTPGHDAAMLYSNFGSAIPTASQVARFDANSNLSAHNFNNGFTTTATAATNTILTVASNHFQYFTGSTTQIVTMPVTSTLVLGQSWLIVNNSSQAVTVNSSGGNAIQVMAANTSLFITCQSTSLTTAAGWNIQYASQAGGIITSGTINQLSYYAASGNVLSGLATANTGFLITSASGVPAITNSITTVVDQSLNTVNGTPTLGISNTANIVYPSVPNFFVTLGTFENLVANTAQTINSSTPGGFNIVYGNFHSLIYSDNGTNDLSSLTLQGHQLSVNWPSTNTASNVQGLAAIANYRGSNQGGRTTSTVLGTSTTASLNSSPASSTVTVSTLTGVSSSCTSTNPAFTGITKTVTTVSTYNSTLTFTSAAASNATTITNMYAYNSAMTLSAAGAGSTLAITNLYGLRLQAPAVGANTTITNRFGVSSEDASANNVFAGIISPSQTLGIAGTTTNNNANAGSVGETLSTVVLIGSPVSLTTATPANIATLTLNSGDWDIWGEVWTAPDVTTTTSSISAAISATTGTLPTVPAVGTALAIQSGFTAAAGTAIVSNTGSCRVSLSGTTTYYLVASVSFAISTLSGYGVIRARRRR